jgi:hypothetical protein
MANMRRVSRAIKRYTAEEFSPSMTSFGEWRDVVAAPEKLEKDYSVR